MKTGIRQVRRNWIADRSCGEITKPRLEQRGWVTTGCHNLCVVGRNGSDQEGYLEHERYVGRVCVVVWESDLLVSGTADGQCTIVRNESLLTRSEWDKTHTFRIRSIALIYYLWSHVYDSKHSIHIHMTPEFFDSWVIMAEGHDR